MFFTAKKCPGENQQYNPCPPNCPPEETCSSYLSGLVVDCAPEPIDRVCKPRCECAPGFIRKTVDGECVKPEQCRFINNLCIYTTDS